MTVTTKFMADERQIDSLDLTISITMEIGEWRAFKKKIEVHGYEAHQVNEGITSAIHAVENSVSGYAVRDVE